MQHSDMRRETGTDSGDAAALSPIKQFSQTWPDRLVLESRCLRFHPGNDERIDPGTEQVSDILIAFARYGFRTARPSNLRADEEAEVNIKVSAG